MRSYRQKLISRRRLERKIVWLHQRLAHEMAEKKHLAKRLATYEDRIKKMSIRRNEGSTVAGLVGLQPMKIDLDVNNEYDASEEDNCVDSESTADVICLETLSKEGGEDSGLLEVFNVPEFLRMLFKGISTQEARFCLSKAFHSHLLLTALRFHDHAKDESSLTGLFSTVHAMLKIMISKSKDLDMLSLWMVNTWRLLNLLRQYSGENKAEWGSQDTEKQNLQRMQSYGLARIREQLRARVEDCYQSLMKQATEPLLIPKIGSVLECVPPLRHQPLRVFADGPRNPASSRLDRSSFDMPIRLKLF